MNRYLELSLKFVYLLFTSCGDGDTEERCQRMVEKLSSTKTPDAIREAIIDSLKSIYAEKWETVCFAVRSSACGEDSEEMSAAGQMKTFLGIAGADNICSALMKCWASQFSRVACEYKKSYGQPIDSGMAVVIQEMVDCDKAGVLFTCDPVTGQQSIITIAANYGLGESVVSASADPDSIKLRVRYNFNRRKLEVTGVTSREIGAKRDFIRLDKTGLGTVQQESNEDERQKCCLSEEEIMKLGQIAIMVCHIFC